MFRFSYDHTAVMGILNITPDSFSDGGQFDAVDAAVKRAIAIEQEGADILDIGAQSTRPGAVPITAEEEWARLHPVLEALRGRVTIPLSVDTFEPLVAENALKAGVSILNDVSGSLKNGFPALAAEHGAALIMMARDAASPHDVRVQFETMLEAAAKSGLPLCNICLDIGVGFHRSREVDLHVIAALPHILKGLPKTAVLCGASRKRLIAYAAGDCDVSERLSGTVALHTAAQLAGATVVRAHDVKDAVQAARVTDKLLQIQKGVLTYDRLETF